MINSNSGRSPRANNLIPHAINTISPRNSVDSRMERDRSSACPKVVSKNLIRSPLITVNSNKRTLFDYHFPNSASSSLNSTPSASRNNSVSNEYIIDLMEREQDGIVLKLMKEIDVLKNEVKQLKANNFKKNHGKSNLKKSKLDDEKHNDAFKKAVAANDNEQAKDHGNDENEENKSLIDTSDNDGNSFEYADLKLNVHDHYFENTSPSNKLNSLSISYKRHPSIYDEGKKKIRTDTDSIMDENIKLKLQITELKQKLSENETVISNLQSLVDKTGSKHN